MLSNMVPCEHTDDGYCIRPEHEYCLSTECLGCKHFDTKTVVIDASVTCEVTVVQCMICDKILTEAKTECR